MTPPNQPQGPKPSTVLPTSASARRERYLNAILRAQLKLLPHSVGPEAFPEVLRIIGEAAGACRAYIFQNRTGTDGRLYMTESAEWCAPGVQTTLESGAFTNLAYDDFLPFWREILRPDQSFGGPVASFPNPARDLLEQFSVQAFLVFPFFTGTMFSGFVGFVSTREPDPWSEVETDLLKGAANAVQFAMERQAAEEKLAQERDILLTVLRSIADPVFVVDANERVSLSNEAASQMLGLSKAEVEGEIIGNLFRVYEEEDHREARSCIATVALETHERVDRLQPGLLITRYKTEHLVLESATPMSALDPVGEGVLIVLRDVTDQVRAWRELENANRLESVGVLAGGIAHNFNNLLMAILGHLSLTKMGVGDQPDITKWLDKAEAAVMRGRDLTGRMLTFAAGGAPNLAKADLTSLAREVVNEVEIDKTGSVEFIESPSVEAEVDPKLFQQALHHIINNGVMASADTKQPVSVSVRLQDAEAEMPLRAVVEVRDQGSGIAPEVRDRIFDPFFSTHSGSTGLGLATARSIVNRHQGGIQLESKKGRGTRVQLWLPIAPQEDLEDSMAQPPAPEVKSQTRLAILEDDVTLRILFESMLDRLGFNVSSASTGEDFLELYEQAEAAGTPFSLGIMDLTIDEGMGGRLTMERLLKRYPNVKCIVASGYSNDPVLADYAKHGFIGSLKKPFDVDTLCHALRDAGVNPDGG